MINDKLAVCPGKGCSISEAYKYEMSMRLIWAPTEYDQTFQIYDAHEKCCEHIVAKNFFELWLDCILNDDANLHLPRSRSQKRPWNIRIYCVYMNVWEIEAHRIELFEGNVTKHGKLENSTYHYVRRHSNEHVLLKCSIDCKLKICQKTNNPICMQPHKGKLFTWRVRIYWVLLCKCQIFPRFS